MHALEGWQLEDSGRDICPQAYSTDVRLVLAFFLGCDVHAGNLVFYYGGTVNTNQN